MHGMLILARYDPFLQRLVDHRYSNRTYVLKNFSTIWHLNADWICCQLFVDALAIDKEKMSGGSRIRNTADGARVVVII